MSLIGLVRQAIDGQATWADVGQKIESLAETGAVDALEQLENFGANFLTKFAPAETQSVATAGVSLLTGSSVASAGSTLLSQTEGNAETAAESALTADTGQATS
jgi:hypothetical protein